MRLMAMDISGNFEEGKGTTGITVMHNDEVLRIYDTSAKSFECAEDYWINHLELIEGFAPTHLVVEGYRLYNHKGMAASSQANSILETPMLLGSIRVFARQNKIPLKIQYATDVKRRWSDEILVKLGYLTESNNRLYFNGKMTNDHQRDSLRHALHFRRYGK